jgi:hypothetical protein
MFSHRLGCLTLSFRNLVESCMTQEIDTFQPQPNLKASRAPKRAEEVANRGVGGSFLPENNYFFP